MRRRADVARLPPLGYGEAPLDYPNRDNAGESNDEATGEPACTARSMLLVLFAAGVNAAPRASNRERHSRNVSRTQIAIAKFERTRGAARSGVGVDCSRMNAAATNAGDASGKSGPYEFVDVLKQEYGAIHLRSATDEDGAAPADPFPGKRLDDVRHEMWKKETAALCLSGGGIRSASFCLGAVQALAREGYLRNFHYLSSVSGGGYLGSMLAAWGYRAGADYGEVEKGLEAKSAKVDPVGRLRDYTSYLAPRYGLLSTDTWTLFSTYLRNLLLNWLMLVPLFCALFLVPHFVVAIASDLVRLPPATIALTTADAMLVAGVLLSVIAIVLWRGTSSLLGRPGARGPRVSAAITGLSIVAGALICTSAFIIQAREFDHPWTAPLGLAAQIAANAIAFVIALVPGEPLRYLAIFLREEAASIPALRLPFAYALLGVAAWLWFRVAQVEIRPLGAVRSWTNLLISFVAAGTATGLALHGWYELFRGGAERAEVARYFWTFAPPSLGVVFGLAEILLIGLVSKQTDDFDREWWARMGARLLIAALLWLALFAIVLLVPAALRSLDLPEIRLLSPALGALILLAGAAIARIAFTRAGAAAGKPDLAPVSAAKGEMFLNAAALAFLVLFLCAVAFALDAALDWISGRPPAPRGGWSRAFSYRYGWEDVWLLLAGFTLVLWIAPRFIHVNRFSLHAMYRERLIRAFLGGTRANRAQPATLDREWKEDQQYKQRDPDPFTGFDRHDNPIFGWLDPRRRAPIAPAAAPKGAAPKSPPFLVVNCALNLAGGERLAWQERKAASFTISALHAGSEDTKYRASRAYAGEVGGITLGTALTISGAAVSPNAGQHSSPILAAVLTLFNARLGSWLGNPGDDATSLKQGPTYALQPLVRELLGRADAKSPWIHLSDGGHFDNLGIYEAVKRGCRWIVAIDASADPERRYTDLGNAIRKIRLDLGARLELTGGWWIGGVDFGARGRYCALFRIRYRGLPDFHWGSLLYVKPAIYLHPSHELPMDVVQYSRAAPAFPHESTVDQFFTESQFESYRALGEHEMAKILEYCKVPGDFAQLFEAAPEYVKQKRA